MTKPNLGLRATDKYWDKLWNGSLDLPKIDNQGRLITQNQMGLMKTELDPFSLAFLESTKGATSPVLELGAAYGAATPCALRNGATVVANDIAKEHLLLLRKQVSASDREQLFLNHGSFPNETDFPTDVFQSILCCRVAHFFQPTEVEIAFDKIRDWLVPGGKLYFVVMSPFHHTLDSFAGTYEKRLKQGVKWPGIIEGVKSLWPEFASDIPDIIHVMDERVVVPALKERGFEIENSQLFDYGVASSKKGRDGREYFGLIAKKKE